MCPAPASRAQGTVMSPVLRQTGVEGSAKGCTQESGRFGGGEPQNHTAEQAAGLPQRAYILLLLGNAKGCTQVRRRISGQKCRNHAAERGRGAAESAYTLLERKKRKGVRTLVHDCGGLATNSRACACADRWQTRGTACPVDCSGFGQTRCAYTLSLASQVFGTRLKPCGSGTRWRSASTSSFSRDLTADEKSKAPGACRANPCGCR